MGRSKIPAAAQANLAWLDPELARCVGQASDGVSRQERETLARWFGGVIVGLIIVYQILFADVQDHLREYATLKAMGYTHGYLRRVVLQEAIILAVIGFLPGMGIAILIFNEASDVTRLPLDMSLGSALGVFGLTLLMCMGSGMLALRKLRSVDPADVF